MSANYRLSRIHPAENPLLRSCDETSWPPINADEHRGNAKALSALIGVHLRPKSISSRVLRVWTGTSARRNSKRGSAMVELSLVGLIFFLLILAILDFGQFLFIQQADRKSTRLNSSH